MEDKYVFMKPCQVGVMWKKLSADEILVSTPGLQELRVSSMGCDIFERCNGKNTTAEIIEYLKYKYPQIPGMWIEYETHKFLVYMQAAGILIMDWDDF